MICTTYLNVSLNSNNQITQFLDWHKCGGGKGGGGGGMGETGELHFEMNSITYSRPTSR